VAHMRLTGAFHENFESLCLMFLAAAFLHFYVFICCVGYYDYFESFGMNDANNHAETYFFLWHKF